MEVIALSQHTTAADAVTPESGSTHSGQIDSNTLLSTILASLEDDKAQEVLTIPLAGKSEIADHMVVATGSSTRQVTAISEKLADRLKKSYGLIARMEGKETGDWVLLDAGDVIVHVFREEVREFYQLEKMWQTQIKPSSKTSGKN